MLKKWSVLSVELSSLQPIEVTEVQFPLEFGIVNKKITSHLNPLTLSPGSTLGGSASVSCDHCDLLSLPML